MKNYLVLVKGSFAEWNRFSDTQKKTFTQGFGNYANELQKLGYLRGGDGCDERSFRLISPSGSKEAARVPTETRDMVTGYFLICVPDEDTAIAIARKCPAFDCGETVELIPCSDE